LGNHKRSPVSDNTPPPFQSPIERGWMGVESGKILSGECSGLRTRFRSVPDSCSRGPLVMAYPVRRVPSHGAFNVCILYVWEKFSSKYLSWWITLFFPLRVFPKFLVCWPPLWAHSLRSFIYSGPVSRLEREASCRSVFLFMRPAATPRLREKVLSQCGGSRPGFPSSRVGERC